MRFDLESSYIKQCDACQRNKFITKKPFDPLHLILIVDKCEDTIFVDFIDPLPPDHEFTEIATITNQLDCDIRLLSIKMNQTSKEFARTFFNEWYCENELLLQIISDRDHIFTSRF